MSDRDIGEFSDIEIEVEEVITGEAICLQEATQYIASSSVRELHECDIGISPCCKADYSTYKPGLKSDLQACIGNEQLNTSLH